MPEERPDLDFGSFDNCIADANNILYYYGSYEKVMQELGSCQAEFIFPALDDYYKNFYLPFYNTLCEMGSLDFYIMEKSNPALFKLLTDISEAIVQNSRAINREPLNAFHELISDLYDGFLYKELRKGLGIKPPERSTIAPIARWGLDVFEGPSTWTTEATAIFDVGAAIVNLPISGAKSGIFMWTTLGHETVGHDILHADFGLREELQAAIWNELKKENIDDRIIHHWVDRVDETASDVLGILNMGPMAAVGTVGFFRAANPEMVLNNIGIEGEAHPISILRGYLAASVVELLSFDGRVDKDKKFWADYIKSKADEDLKKRSNELKLSWKRLDPEMSKTSAEIVAKAIATTQLGSLENHRLIDVQNWSDEDEEIVKAFRELNPYENLPLEYTKDDKFYATHVVAAAVRDALRENAKIPSIFNHMIDVLDDMHNWHLIHKIKRYEDYSKGETQ